MALLLVPCLYACSSKVSTKLTQNAAPLEANSQVVLYGLDEEVPESAVELGMVKVGDTGFSTNCGWDYVVERAKMEAKKAGGNIVKITKHIPPSAFGSSCDRITAKIMKVDDTSLLTDRLLQDRAIVDSTWNYAKLYVYRVGGPGSLIGYNLFLGDSLIGRVKNNSRLVIKLTKEGMNTLWAKTEAKSEVPIVVEFGREYYLRCSVTMGVMVGHPQLQLVNHKTGKMEFEPKKKKKQAL